MSWLNYHHLLYFHAVAREGSVTGAARSLRVSPSTVSAQVSQLEDALGQPLFEKSGRNIALTRVGRTVLRYADEIFVLGRELVEFVQGNAVRRLHLHVGLSMVVPKQVAVLLMEPALKLEQQIHLFCKEGPVEDLLAELANHHLDVVISDAPLGPGQRFKAFSHFLGECAVVFVASPEMAQQLRPGFPKSLDGAPVLLPTPTNANRRALDRWFLERDIHPAIVAEFDDSALMKAFGQRGHGVFPVPLLVLDEVSRQYNVEVVGRATGVSDRFYAISGQSQIDHPGVVAIEQVSRESLFSVE